LPRYICQNCGYTQGLAKSIYFCPKCNDPLTIEYSELELREKSFDGRGVWRYRSILPVGYEGRVSMNEGGTPLQQSVQLASELGLKSLYFKNDGLNPTASFKDRGMTVAITRAKEMGAGAVACASTGNTAASLAAYAARARIKAVVVMPEGAVASGKLYQIVAYGARIIKIRGNFDDSLRLLVEASRRTDRIYLMNSVNPFRLEGQKTVGMEIMEELELEMGEGPDWISIPVGNAGNISALWKGLNELKAMGKLKRLPRLLGVQAEGASPIFRAYREGRQEIEPVASPQTVASAIKIGSPASWRRALKAVKESKGAMVSVNDGQILEYQYFLSSKEGVFAEPASAASVAGLREAIDRGIVEKGAKAVAIITGNGLKDLETAGRLRADQVIIDADQKEFMAAVES